MDDNADVESGLGEYFGSDMQLQVEIVGSPTSPDVRTTITQAGCGGSTVDTVHCSHPVPGVNKGLIGGSGNGMNGSNNGMMGSNNGIIGSGNGIVGSVAGEDESDYYTPDEPCTTILSPVQECVESQNHPKQSAPSHVSTTENGGIGGTPILKNNNWNTSLPGTPLSTASHRSSGDSYSSSSSTKQLLTYENSTLT
uniref:Uncharacterized protein n=1 Tax=Cacopsylla melanoneura TaxID=428564 RepID=A0A8D9BIW8_9HEMI